MYDITPAETLMVTVYWILVLFWFAVLVTAVVLWKVRKPKVPSRYYDVVGVAFAATALVLFLDSTYWALANSAGVDVLSGELEHHFRNPRRRRCDSGGRRGPRGGGEGRGGIRRREGAGRAHASPAGRAVGRSA